MAGSETVVDGVGLRFESTVPCQLTHRRAVGEVFVTDSARLDERRFLAAIQLPRAHGLWADRSVSYQDPLAIIEAGRQVAFLIIHRYLGVPIGLPFVLGRVDFGVDDQAALAHRTAAPFEAVMRASLANREDKDGIITNLSFHAEVVVDAKAAMTLGGEIQFLSRSDYELMRRFSRKRKRLEGRGVPPLPRPIDRALVDRERVQNVVIGEGRSAEGADVYPVIVDQTHPSFFDHGQDHVPGPLILEAYRQAGVVTLQRSGVAPSPSPEVVGGGLSFAEFAEFEAPVECVARLGGAPDGRPQVHLSLRQCDTEVANAVYTFARQPE